MFSAIITAAGSGSRMQLGYNKMFLKINGEYLINLTLKVFLSNPSLKQIIVTANKTEIKQMQEIINNPLVEVVEGSSERYLSIINGLKHVNQEYVLIHDGARSNLSSDLLTKIIEATKTYQAAFLGVESKDTMHIINQDNRVVETPNRANLISAQTPQGFQTKAIIKAYEKALAQDGQNITDDVMVMAKYGEYQPVYIESSYANIKITTKEDLIWIE